MLHVISLHSQHTLPSYVLHVPNSIFSIMTHRSHAVISVHNKQAWAVPLSQARPCIKLTCPTIAHTNTLMQTQISCYKISSYTLAIINSHQTCYIDSFSNLLLPYFAGQFIIIFQCSILYITTLNYILLTDSFTIYYCVADLTDMTCYKYRNILIYMLNLCKYMYLKLKT